MIQNTTAPIISVIVPVFNTEIYLERCLDSIINQSIKNIEIIISNDLSTDNSEIIILDYVKKYPFIKYLKMKEKGSAGGARNLGLSKVTGKYVGFVDSDDWIDTMMFEKMIGSIEQSNADISICGVITEFENLHDSVKRYEYKIKNVIEGRVALDLLSRLYNQDISISPIVCNKIYRTQFLKDHQFSFMSNNYNEDDVFNFLCFLDARKVAITPNTYYHYYQRQNSTMHVFSKKYIDDLIDAFTLIKNHLNKKNIYEIYMDNYYSYFERSLASILNILETTETDPKKQGEYIKYLLNKTYDSLIFSDYFNYITIKRIKNFLTPHFTR